MGYLYQQLAGAQDEPCVCVANPAGKLPKGARITGVAVGAKQHLACRQRSQRTCSTYGRSTRAPHAGNSRRQLYMATGRM